MTSASSHSPSLRVDGDASTIVRHPRLFIMVLAGIAGAMDVVNWREFGVFTANQAGNLVLIWIWLQESAGQFWLCLWSLGGCALGIASVVWLRRWLPWFSTPTGVRALMSIAAVILVATAISGLIWLPAVQGGKPSSLDLSGAEWVTTATAVASAAFSIAMLATIFTRVGSTQVSAIAMTGSFVNSVRYGSADLAYRNPQWTAKWKSLVGYPTAWMCGAAVAAFVPVGHQIIALAGAVIVVMLMIAFRQPQSHRESSSANE